jgi:hypothetical protein
VLRATKVCFFIFHRTSPQNFVALSTTEAEFTNLTPAALSAKWVMKILEECGYPQPAPLRLFTDSKNAWQTVMSPTNAAHTITIDIRYKWIIEQRVRRLVRVEHVPGIEMLADGLTKALGKEKHQNFVIILGIGDDRKVAK